VSEEQWVDVSDPGPLVDAPPMEEMDPGGPPAHDEEGSAAAQGGGDAADVEPVPGTDAEGRPFAGPDEPA
jgi:hypothetical protein